MHHMVPIVPIILRSEITCPHCDLKAVEDMPTDRWRSNAVKAFIAVVAWCILVVLCWPLAVVALVLWPVAWLLALPFRLVGITFSALFAFLQALLLLPARVIGWRPRHAAAA